MADFAPAASVQDEILALLVSTPTPQQIIAFHASDAAQERLRYLLEASREGRLTPQETLELDEADQLNHLMILLKARAHKLYDEGRVDE